MTYSEKVLLENAKSDVSDCVKYVVEDLTKSAEKRDWEVSWFIEEFRSQFNKKVKEIM